MDVDVRTLSALREPFRPAVAADDPDLFAAGAELLAVAAAAHASLLDAMLFPSSMGAGADDDSTARQVGQL
jgi:hypothetical protein